MLQIIYISDNHYHELAKFLAGFNDNKESYDDWLLRFRMWWDENPAAAGERHYGWILIHDVEGIVGFIGVIPTYFRLHNEEKIALNATTWRVIPNYHSHSIKLFLKMMAAANESIIFNNSPGQYIVPMLEKLHFKKIPMSGSASDKLAGSIIVLNLPKLLKHRYKKQTFKKLIAISLSAFVKRIHNWRLHKINQAKLLVKEIANADQSFNVLWNRTRECYANTAVRTAEVINWYCSGINSGRVKLFGCYAEQQLLGFALLWERRDENSDKLECIDFWVDPNSNTNGQVTQSLVSCIFHYAKKQTFDMVIFPHFTNSLAEDLQSLGLLKLAIRNKREFFLVKDSGAAKITQENSYFADYQGDAIYF